MSFLGIRSARPVPSDRRPDRHPADASGRAAVERSLRAEVPAAAVWVVPHTTATPFARAAAATRRPVVDRSMDIRAGGEFGAPTWVMAVPGRERTDGLAILARREDPFLDGEVARAGWLVNSLSGLSSQLPGPASRGRDRPSTGRWVRLRDGSPVVVRRAAEEDRLGLLSFHARCSDASLRARFFGAVPVLSTAMLDHLVGQRPGRSLSLVCESGHRIVAVGNLVLTDSPAAVASTAGVRGEVAILVEDGEQRRGIGSALLRELLAAAAGRGLERVTAFTQVSNTRIRALVDRMVVAGWSAPDGGVMAAELSTRRLAAMDA